MTRITLAMVAIAVSAVVEAQIPPTPPAPRLALGDNGGGSGRGADDLAVPATRPNSGESAGECSIWSAYRL